MGEAGKIQNFKIQKENLTLWTRLGIFLFIHSECKSEDEGKMEITNNDLILRLIPFSSP